jgi:hypothetical protein
MKLDKVPASGNQIEYGVWTDEAPLQAQGTRPALDELRQRKLAEFAAGVPDLAGKLGVTGKITRVVFAEPKAQFIQDTADVGQREQWNDPARRPAPEKLRPIYLGEHWDNQQGAYAGRAWYFTSFSLSGDDYHTCDAVHLLFGGVEKECRVYINGRLVGEHKGWQDTFAIPIPRDTSGPIRWDAAVRNDLTIEVYSHAGMGGVYGHVALVLSQSNHP